jgi:CBS domain-containing protein
MKADRYDRESSRSRAESATVDRRSLQRERRLAKSVMVTVPKTLSSSATVGDVRDVFTDDHVHMVLLTDRRRRLLGTLVRTDVSPAARDDDPALAHSLLEGRTVRPDECVTDGHVELGLKRLRRLAVVGIDNELLGLICLKLDQSGFCNDVGIQARRADRERQNPVC